MTYKPLKWESREQTPFLLSLTVSRFPLSPFIRSTFYQRKIKKSTSETFTVWYWLSKLHHHGYRNFNRSLDHKIWLQDYLLKADWLKSGVVKLSTDKVWKREINTVAARAAPGDLRLKSLPKDYQQKLTY